MAAPPVLKTEGHRGLTRSLGELCGPQKAHRVKCITAAEAMELCDTATLALVSILLGTRIRIYREGKRQEPSINLQKMSVEQESSNISSSNNITNNNIDKNIYIRCLSCIVSEIVNL